MFVVGLCDCCIDDTSDVLVEYSNIVGRIVGVWDSSFVNLIRIFCLNFCVNVGFDVRAIDFELVEGMFVKRENM